MLALISYLMTLFGKSPEFSDSERRNIRNAIGRMGLSGHQVMRRYKGTWRYGGPERKPIRKAGFLISRMWLGTLWFFWRMNCVKSETMIVLEVKHYLRWRENS